MLNFSVQEKISEHTTSKIAQALKLAIVAMFALKVPQEENNVIVAAKILNAYIPIIANNRQNDVGLAEQTAALLENPV